MLLQPRTERFNESVARQMLVDPRFEKEDRAKLANYVKRSKGGGGAVSTTYRFGVGCTDIELSRVYAMGTSLQNLPKTIRNPLIMGVYHDCDMVNAAVSIAHQMCIKLDLPRARLTHYIENRAALLASINPDDKGAAKQLLLSCLFGGDPSREFAAAEADPTASLQGEAAPFCAGFAAECRGLAAAVWAMAPDLHGLKLGKDRKAAGEYVFQQTELKMHFISKDIVADYIGPEKGTLTPYQAMKASFEETHFMLDDKILDHATDTLKSFSWASAKVKWANLRLEEVSAAGK
ncbi:hypothetical protein B484DRAFT_411479, partial [Ochromonadaceae sp. CCMP2298]